MGVGFGDDGCDDTIVEADAVAFGWSSDDFLERLGTQRWEGERSVGDHLADRRVLQWPFIEIGTNGRHAANPETAGNDDGAQETLPLGVVGQCPTFLELIDDEHQLPTSPPRQPP